MRLRNLFLGLGTKSVLGMMAIIGTSTSIMAESGRRVLFDFDKEVIEAWRSVNDNVMGGRSEGSSRITESGVLEFYGNLSLENRGGFASIRCAPGEIDLSKSRAIVLRVRGDGRTYYCNLHVPTSRVAYSYRASFETEPGQWQEIKIPMKQFQATWFGRVMKSDPPIDSSKVLSIGLMIADKKPGPFKLEVDWIKSE